MVEFGHTATLVMPHHRPPPDIEQVRFRARREALDLEVFSMADLRSRADRAHLRRYHRYDFHAFVYVERGRCRAIVDFQAYDCAPGTLLAVRPGQVHRFGEGSAWDGTLLLFRQELLSGAIGAERYAISDLLDALPAQSRLDAALRRYLRGALARMQAAGQLAAERTLLNVLLEGELSALVARLHVQLQGRGLPKGDGGDARRMREFQMMLDARIRDWRHVSRYARALGCSDRTLTRCCRAQAGVGAKTYIARRLALEAKRLLVHTDATIAEIAASLHFNDDTNFVKFFRSVEACTPGAFRRRFQEAA